MSWQCLKPLVAVSRFKNADDKHSLRFISDYEMLSKGYNLKKLKESFGDENVFLLPCGSCESCRRNYAENWSIRCVLESKYHKFNYFITLTFDDRHIAIASKKDFDKFLDRLEGKGHKRKFKYFACMERGETTGRLHFHALLFCDFELDLYDATKIGDFYYYHSSILDETWTFGLHNVAPFESSCARYVAKYTNKGDNKIFMSRNLGKQYIVDNQWQIAKDDFQVYGDFGSKYVALLPPSMIRWMHPSLALKGLSLVKGIGATVNHIKVHQYGFPHEEVVIMNAREKAFKTKSQRRCFNG